jgi:hypothetical protein
LPYNFVVVSCSAHRPICLLGLLPLVVGWLPAYYLSGCFDVLGLNGVSRVSDVVGTSRFGSLVRCSQCPGMQGKFSRIVVVDV